MKRLSLLFLSLISVLLVMGKTMITVQGIVYGRDTGQVIVGALIRDKASENSTTTDVDGRFILNVEEGSTLEVSSIGYAPKSVKAKNSHIYIYLGKERGIGFSVKPYGELNLGNSFTYESSSFSGFDISSTKNRFGLDFGYAFLKKKGYTLEINAGIAYSKLSNSIYRDSFEYSYWAPPAADVDLESYDRYYRVYYLDQKINVGYVSVPVYLSSGYKFGRWIGLHLELGVNLDFSISKKMSEVRGLAYSYGIYPQFDNLLIDAPYMNDFGETDLSNAEYGEPSVNSLYASFFAGLGIEFYIYGPLSLDISARYNLGLTNIYQDLDPDYYMDYSQVPVSYWDGKGQIVAPFTNYMNSSKLNQLSLRVGLNFRF